MQVIRSDRPERVKELSQHALKSNDKAFLDRIPEIIEKEGGRYRLVGYLGRDRAGRTGICNAQGIEVEPLQPYDSFVSGLPAGGDEDDEPSLPCFVTIPKAGA
jgi:hypothetical protein